MTLSYSLDPRRDLMSKIDELCAKTWEAGANPPSAIAMNPRDVRLLAPGATETQLQGKHMYVTDFGNIQIIADPNCTPGTLYVISTQANTAARVAASKILVSSLLNPKPKPTPKDTRPAHTKRAGAIDFEDES